MAHTYTNLLIHALFGTQDRRPFLDPELKPKLFAYMAVPHAARRHPETMKKDASVADSIRVCGVDWNRDRAGTRPTLLWRYEPAWQSGQDVATNPKLKARKRPRKADC